MKKKMKKYINVYVAVVSHKHGNNCYIESSLDRLDKRLAEHCTEWWSHEIEWYNPDNVLDPLWSNQELIDKYFEEQCDFEWYEVFIDKIEVDETI